jgi:hypothetical protein
MAILTLKGEYRDGHIELETRPEGLDAAHVFVMFLPLNETEKAELNSKREEAGQKMLSQMREGRDFGGQKFNREEIYEERMQELEARRSKNQKKEQEKEEAREQALQRIFARLDKGMNLGGGPYYTSREELYEDRYKRSTSGDR